MYKYRKTFFSTLSYDTVMAQGNAEAQGLDRVGVEDGKPLMKRLDAEQEQAMALKSRTEAALVARDEAGAEYEATKRKLVGAIKMALGFGQALELENFSTEIAKDVPAQAAAISPRLANVTEAPVEEVKHFLDHAAKGHEHAEKRLVDAEEKVAALDAEWVTISASLKRLIRMAKVLQVADGLKVTRRKRKSRVVAPLPTPDPVVVPFAEPAAPAAPAVSSVSVSTETPDSNVA
jgi:hypothetical protein